MTRFVFDNQNKCFTDKRLRWRGFYQTDKHDNENKVGHSWTWDHAVADDGLLYYWTKYYKKSVTIIMGDETEHWWSTTSSLTASTSLRHVVWNSKLLMKHNYTCVPSGMETKGHWASGNIPRAFERAPYRDFLYFGDENSLVRASRG